MTNIVKPGWIAGWSAAAVTALAVWRGRRGPPQSGAPGMHGTIRPDRCSAGLTIALAVAFVLVSVLGVAGVLRTALPWGAALGGSLASCLVAACMAPSLTPLRAVHWNDTGIEGPCTPLGLILGARRAVLRWEEIIRAGETATGYWYVESGDGQRVYWSFLYPGYGALVQAVRKRLQGRGPGRIAGLMSCRTALLRGLRKA